jgi:hypothetical protein
MTGHVIRGSLFVVVALSGCASNSETAHDQKVTLPRTEKQCLAAGGEWILLGPQMVAHSCMLKAKDGGKSCVTSAQCQSECVEYEGGNRCAEYVDGCFEPTGRGTVTQCVN